MYASLGITLIHFLYLINHFTRLENNPLVNAPHTQLDIVDKEWDYDYDYEREVAVFPLEYIKDNKFWPFVNRIDNAYGDRNLVCSCPSLEEYTEE